MKKFQWNKVTYATVGILAIFLCLALCFVGTWFERGISITTGRCVVSDNDTVLLIVEDGYSEGFPVSLGYDGDKEKAFADWSTGDLVTVIHDGIRETYPGQSQMYFGWHKEEGSRSDISEDILKQLTEMGWIKEPVVASYEAEVEGKQVRIQLELPSLWQAEQVPYTGEDYVGCGLALRSVNDPEVEVQISYYPHIFGMCGTGVEFEDITMYNGQPATLATEKRHDGGIWVTFIMGDITRDDSFVAHYDLTKKQKKLYEDDILDMLLGVAFQAE